MQSKQQLRQELIRQRRAVPPEEKQHIDREITKRLLDWDGFCHSKTVFLYFSVEDEISTREILTACWDSGKIVCLPKCLPNHRMTARRVRSLTDLTEQTYGIPEPGVHCPEFFPEQFELCIVPALACDRSGYRLGYGGGFYDRFLRWVRCDTAALCAAQRLFTALPTEEFDIPCSYIITENEVLKP